MRRLGYQVHSLEQYIPPGSIGRVVESLHLWSAEEFRKQLSHNIKRGLRYIVTVHHAYPMPHTPVGYRKEPSQIGIRRNGEPHLVNRLVPDPATRAAVLRAFELRASRQSIAEIHALINLFPSRTGYQHMFRNEIYRGVFIYGDLRIDDFCEAIIPGELWRSVQEVNREWADWRRDSMTATHPRRVGSPYLLSGLVRCAHCGRAMAGHTTTTKTGPYRYYICTSHTNTTTDGCAALQIRAADLENAVLRLALDFVSNEAVLQSLVEAVRLELSTRPDDAAANLQRIQADVRNCEQAIDNLLRALEMTGTSRAIADRLRELEQQRGDLAERLGEAQRAIDARRGFDPQTAEDSAAGARLSLGQVDARQRQLALRSIIREIRATRSSTSTVIFSLPGLGIDTPAEFRL